MTVVGATVIGGGVGVAYLSLLRPWQLSWGATDDECERLLPGDDVENEQRIRQAARNLKRLFESGKGREAALTRAEDGAGESLPT